MSSINTGEISGFASYSAEKITATGIQNAIVQALLKCPNLTCTFHSLRGNRRDIFEKRVMRNLNVLEEKGILEKYKAKNKRIRLMIGQASIF